MAPEFNLEFAFNLFLKYRQLQRRKLNCHLNEDFDTIITLLLRKKKKNKIKALLSIILALAQLSDQFKEKFVTLVGGTEFGIHTMNLGSKKRFELPEVHSYIS